MALRVCVSVCHFSSKMARDRVFAKCVLVNISIFVQLASEMLSVSIVSPSVIENSASLVLDRQIEFSMILNFEVCIKF